MSKLFLVPTPIGNLNDMTFRAVQTLKDVDIVLAEDTRVSGKLLKHFEIDTPMKSYHQHNEHHKTDSIIKAIKNGQTHALISDAGTPAISDPGFLLVRECVEAGVQIESLPGATAFVPALVNSGLPNDKFIFEGFLPVKKGRKTKLEELAKEKRTFILYESPYKLIKTLKNLEQHLGEDRQISISRELTKLYEETLRGSIKEMIMHFETHKPKGEFVLVVSAQ